MLLKRVTLDRISNGEIDLAFRRWKRPTVKTGGTLRTAVGMLQIESVERVEIDSTSIEDAHRAGEERHDLIAFLNAKHEGDVYRVGFGSFVPDPRLALRESDDLSNDDIAEIEVRLDRFDRASHHGPWTRQFLELIEGKPRVRAQDLADLVGVSKPSFKNDVRKLKELGLTISHSPGYELSPRGRAPYLRG